MILIKPRPVFCALNFRLTAVLLHWVCYITIPKCMLKDPCIQVINDITGCHAFLLNDLYSYQCEVSIAQQNAAGKISKGIINAIVPVMHDQNVGEQEAINYLQGYVSQLEDNFLDAAKNAKLCYSGNDLELLEKYVNTLEVMCAGNAKWSAVCGRYNCFVSVRK